MRHLISVAAAFVALCPAAFSSDYALVFGQPETRAELGLGEEAAEYARNLNRDYIAGIRSLPRDATMNDARQELMNVQDVLVMEYLNPAQQKRLKQLVFQMRLLKNKPSKALSGEEIELTQEQMEQIGKLKNKVLVEQRKLAFARQRERLGELFEKARVDELVGELVLNQPLPRITDELPLPHSDKVKLLANTEALRFTGISVVQEELALTPKQITDLHTLRKTHLKDAPVVAAMDRLIKLTDSLASVDEELDNSDAEFAKEAIYASASNEVKEAESKVATSVEQILTRRQMRRLKQLLLQSAMHHNRLERGLSVIGIDMAKLDAGKVAAFRKERRFDVQDAITVEQLDKAQDMWLASLTETLGASKVRQLAGKKIRFETRLRKKSSEPVIKTRRER